jgi:hypothetical protein
MQVQVSPYRAHTVPVSLREDDIQYSQMSKQCYEVRYYLSPSLKDAGEIPFLKCHPERSEGSHG